MDMMDVININFNQIGGQYIYKTSDFIRHFDRCQDNPQLQRSLNSFIERFVDKNGEYPQSQLLSNGIYRFPPSGNGRHDWTLFFYKTSISFDGVQQDLHVIYQFYITGNDTQRRKKDELTRDPAVVRDHEQEIQKEFQGWLKEKEKNQILLQEEENKNKAVDLEQKTQWLRDFKIKTEFHIFETHEWINAMRSPELSDYRIKVYEAIQLIYDRLGDKSADKKLHETRQLFLWEQDHLSLVYESAQIHSDKFVLLLHHVMHTQDVQAKEKMIEQALHKNYDFRLSQSGLYDLHEISRVADRAYPDFLLSNDKLWIDIQKTDDNSSNLSLLPAQIEILEQLRFPVFINGQAGSGKSTLLFYLFADLCYLRLMGEEPQEPVLFITENQRLLEKSRDEIVELLVYNPAYELLAGELDEKQPEARKRQILSRLKDAFNTLKQFMLSQASNLDLERFEEHRFVDFYKFKEQYLKSHAITRAFRNKYSPEMAWYVIRTFIKGYDKDRIIAPENYTDIPNRDRKNIHFEDFKEIYEKVWLRFYKPLQEQGFWDHLDLVRVLFESQQIFARHAFIVCDEAQDFTKLELEFLIKCLSISEGYDLSRLERFPLLFAGDPFQTVNPTGFSWQRLKSMFTEEIVNRYRLQITSEHQNQMVQELHINYRSTPELVLLANAIQYFRITQLQNDLALPQEARQYPSGKLTYLLPIPDEENIAYLSQMDSIIVIVPCEMGEEQAYQKDDKVADLNYAMLSAGLVKGLEEPKIAVYKFGKYFVDTFLKTQDGQTLSLSELIERYPIHSDGFFRMAYFFNKLYVAVTRAREELYIIDTESAVEQFWKPLEAFIQDLLQHCDSAHAENQYKAENNKFWKQALLQNDQTLSLFSASDPELEHLENIERWKKEVDFADTRLKQYIADENPDLIQKVCLPAYLRADRIDSTMVTRAGIAECKAYYAWFQEDWPIAGDAFLGLKEHEKAKKAYWYAGKWRDIYQMAESGYIQFNPFEAFIVDFMRTQNLQLETFIVAVEFAINNGCLELIEDSRLTWRSGDNFIPALANRIREQTLDNEADWLRLARALEVIKMNRPKWRRLIGDCFVKGRAYEDALKYYDVQRDKDHPEYLEAISQSEQGSVDEQLKIALEVLENKHASPSSKSESKERLEQLYLSQPDIFNSQTAYKQLYIVLWEKSKDDFHALIPVVESIRKKHKLDWRQFFTAAYSAQKVSQFIRQWLISLKSRNLLDSVDIECLMALDIFQETFKPYTKSVRLHRRLSEQDNKIMKDAAALAEAMAQFIVHSNIQPNQLEGQNHFSVYQIMMSYIRRYYERPASKFSLPFLVTLYERTETYFTAILKAFESLKSRQGLSEEDLVYLQVRSLKVRCKQIEHIKNNPNPDKKNDPSRLEKELKEKHAKAGLNLSLEAIQALPEYPAVDETYQVISQMPIVQEAIEPQVTEEITSHPIPEASEKPLNQGEAHMVGGNIEKKTPGVEKLEAVQVTLPTPELGEVFDLNTLQKIAHLQRHLQDLEKTLLQCQSDIVYVRQQMDTLIRTCLFVPGNQNFGMNDPAD